MKDCLRRSSMALNDVSSMSNILCHSARVRKGYMHSDSISIKNSIMSTRRMRPFSTSASICFCSTAIDSSMNDLYLAKRSHCHCLAAVHKLLKDTT